MPHRVVSTGSRIARLRALIRRHRDLDDRIDREQARRWPDAQSLKRLKLKRLGLRDAIRETRSALVKAGTKPSALSSAN